MKNIFMFAISIILFMCSATSFANELHCPTQSIMWDWPWKKITKSSCIIDSKYDELHHIKLWQVHLHDSNNWQYVVFNYPGKNKSDLLARLKQYHSIRLKHQARVKGELVCLYQIIGNNSQYNLAELGISSAKLDNF